MKKMSILFKNWTNFWIFYEKFWYFWQKKQFHKYITYFVLKIGIGWKLYFFNRIVQKIIFNLYCKKKKLKNYSFFQFCVCFDKDFHEFPIKTKSTIFLNSKIKKFPQNETKCIFVWSIKCFKKIQYVFWVFLVTR